MTTWTKEPPKEPGWYWSRVVLLYNEGPWTGEPRPTFCYSYSRAANEREWWPIPILPPPTEQEKT